MLPCLQAAHSFPCCVKMELYVHLLCVAVDVVDQVHKECSKLCECGIGGLQQAHGVDLFCGGNCNLHTVQSWQ